MKRYFPILSFLILFLTYFFTAFRGLTYTDNGELAAVATTLGVSHPTGYPLFTILAHLWTYLPLPFSDIFQLNLFSSFCMAMAAMVLFYVLSELINSKQKMIELFGSIAFGLGNILWGNAVSLEVYSLHVLLFNLILLFSFKYLRNYDSKNLLILSFLLGISFSNHLTTVLIVPSLIILLLNKHSREYLKSPKFWLTIFGLIAVGLSFYLYLPLRSAQSPLFDWGNVSRGFSKFYYHITGKQYQVWMFSDSEVMKSNIVEFFRFIPKEMNILTVFIPLGFFHLLDKKKPIFWFLILAILSNVVYSSGYTIHDIANYFSPSFICFEIMALFGIYSIIKSKKKYLQLLLILVPLISFFQNYNLNNHRNNKIVPEFIDLLFQNVPENSIIISSQWDFWCSAFWYKQQVEGYREDVILIEKELMRRTWYPNQMFKWYPELEKSRGELDSYLEILEQFEEGGLYDRREIQIRFLKLLNSFATKYENERDIFITADILSTEKGMLLEHHKFPYGLLFKVLPEPNYSQLSPEKFNINSFKSQKREFPSYMDYEIFRSASQSFASNAYYAASQKEQINAIIYAEMSLQLDSTNLLAQKIIRDFNK